MNNLKISLILMATIGFVSLYGSAFAISQPNIECQPASICVHPGDFVTYSTEFGHVPSIETYTFGDYIGADKVSVSITSITNGTKIQSNNLLDLKTGFYNETTDSSGFPIIVIRQTPILINKDLAGYSEGPQNFNGTKREVVIATTNNPEFSGEIAYDKETGILMYYHSTNHPSKNQTSLNNDHIIGIKYDLINTNIFASSGSQSQIPTWIKNDAKWWSQEQVGDSEFIQGIQYLIKQGIIKIPQTQSDSSLSKQVPIWVKTNAGWWANDQISDNDFVKGLQYLVSSGIIQV